MIRVLFSYGRCGSWITRIQARLPRAVRHDGWTDHAQGAFPRAPRRTRQRPCRLRARGHVARGGLPLAAARRAVRPRLGRPRSTSRARRARRSSPAARSTASRRRSGTAVKSSAPAAATTAACCSRTWRGSMPPPKPRARAKTPRASTSWWRWWPAPSRRTRSCAATTGCRSRARRALRSRWQRRSSWPAKTPTLNGTGDAELSPAAHYAAGYEAAVQWDAWVDRGARGGRPAARRTARSCRRRGPGSDSHDRVNCVNFGACAAHRRRAPPRDVIFGEGHRMLVRPPAPRCWPSSSPRRSARRTPPRRVPRRRRWRCAGSGSIPRSTASPFATPTRCSSIAPVARTGRGVGAAARRGDGHADDRPAARRAATTRSPSDTFTNALLVIRDGRDRVRGLPQPSRPSGRASSASR